jgi:hypothetical protein
MRWVGKLPEVAQSSAGLGFLFTIEEGKMTSKNDLGKKSAHLLAAVSVVAVAALVVTLLSGSSLQAQCSFVRGNVVDPVEGGDPVVDLNDGVGLLAFLFLGRSIPDCIDAADVNDNGLVEISDYAFLVNYMFADGPEPPAPFTTAGTDPTPGVTIPSDGDPRFTFTLGASAGVPNNTGIAIPVTLSNTEPITGLTMVFQYSPAQIRIDEMVTEENTLLSIQSAEYIIAEFDNNRGVAFISALKDFATPFWFQVSSDPYLPAGENQLVATLKCGIVVSADMGFAPIAFADGLKIYDDDGVPIDTEKLPEAHNLVALGAETVRPVLSTGGGIDIRRGFIRGDSNKDDGVDISDPVFLINYIFLGMKMPPCLDAADANNDTRVDISDPIWLLNYLFKGGPQPSEPFPQPGVDPSDDGKGSLGCESDT